MNPGKTTLCGEYFRPLCNLHTVTIFDTYLKRPQVQRQVRDIKSPQKISILTPPPQKKKKFDVPNIGLKGGGAKMLFDSKLVSKSSQE